MGGRSSLREVGPVSNESDLQELRRALATVADARAYLRANFSAPSTGYVGRASAAEYDAAVDTLVSGLTVILDAGQ